MAQIPPHGGEKFSELPPDPDEAQSEVSKGMRATPAHEPAVQGDRPGETPARRLGPTPAPT